MGTLRFFTGFVLALGSMVSACSSDEPNASKLQSGGYLAFAPKLVASFGDSRSTGAFSNTQAGAPLPPEALELMGKLPVGWFLGNVLNLPVGLRMTQNLVAVPEVNAFSGSKDYSHRSRFAQLKGSNVEGIQFAKVGGSMASLDWQLDEARETYARKGTSADYVVFDVGAVDFFMTEDVAAFRHAYERHFSTVLRMHPGARILVLTLPDIVTLMSSPEQPVAVELPVLGTIRCDAIRSFLRLGDESGLGPGALPQKRAAKRAQLESMNIAIRDAVKVARRNVSFSGNVVVAEPYEIVRNDDAETFAFDCLHPSLTGLRTIAVETWDMARRGGLF